MQGLKGSTLRPRCPLWVKSRHVHCERPCPLHPQKRTWVREAQFNAAAVSRRTSPMIFATSPAIFGPCVFISENSVSEIKSYSPDLKLGHSRAKAHQSLTCGRSLIHKSSRPK